MTEPLPLGDDEFRALCRLLEQAAGLAFDVARRQSLGFSVADRMRAIGLDDVSAYLELVTAPHGADERQALLDEVTVPETHFFRNPPQVRALRAHVLPALVRAAADRRRLRVWSAGCSTGEEPYTVAMLLRELLPAAAGWDVQVLATDVSQRALAAARAARYGQRAFVMTEPQDQARWFVREEAEVPTWTVREEVRELVEFRHHNLVTELAPFAPGEVDLVLCRNVTIYFGRETTKALMHRLHATLRDGGYLFLGHAETLWQINEQFRLVSLGDAFVYRRLDGGSRERRSTLPERRTARDLVLTDRREQRERRARVVAAAPVRPVVADPLGAARAAVEAARYAEAVDLAADVVAAEPLRGDAHYLHGLALANLGRDGEALIALRKAVYLDPANGFAHFLLAGALERVGELRAAGQSYRAAALTLGRRPGDAVAAELGGRSVAELAALCHELAVRCSDRVHRHPRTEPPERGEEIA